MAEYTLNISFVSGNTVELTLDKPHRLVPDPTRPHALVYTDSDNMTHNIPFTSIEDFWFNPELYNQCEEASGTLNTIRLPTPGCECASCKKTKEILKKAVG